MFEYKTTEKFDIGAGYGKYEYDFFTINDEDDFQSLIYHYGAIYRRFEYFLDGYKFIENNTDLSAVVQTKMKEHNANFCLTFLEEPFKENNAGIREMVVNKQKPNGIYETYFFSFYHFETMGAKNYLGCGVSYAKSGLHNAAIRHFSHAIRLDPGLGLAFFYRGISFFEKRNYDKAIEDFTRAINFDMENPELFSFRGVAYKKAGDFDKAIADFAMADEMTKKSFANIHEKHNSKEGRNGKTNA